MLNHIGTMKLETKRLILRPFTQADASDMFHNWASDDEVTRYLTWPTHTEQRISEGILLNWVERYKEPDYYHWGILIKETDQVIGSISMMNVDNHNESCEVGYCIGRAWWNQGLMTEAFNEVLRFGLEVVGFERIVAKHDILNPASGCVMKKCDLQYEGTQRKALKNREGKLVDCMCYSILKEDYNRL